MKKILRSFILILCSINAFSQNEPIDTLEEQKQKLNLAYTSLYKENSQMSYTSPFGELGAPSGYVINGKLTTTYLVFGPSNLPVALAINPDFIVRVRTEKSAGVRTPSFKLGGTFYLRLAQSALHYRYAELGFSHHSNGQDGDAAMPDGSINTLNGNFNTNYLLANYRFGNFSGKRSQTGIYYGYHHKVGLEWHKWFNYEPVLNGDYGFTRLNYDFSFRIYQIYTAKKSNWKKVSAKNVLGKNTLEKETWRFDTQFSYAINKYDYYNFFAVKRRLNAEISANYSLPFMHNVFLMASFGYYGEDPYNIYFKDRYAYARFGLSSTFSRYLVRER